MGWRIVGKNGKGTAAADNAVTTDAIDTTGANLFIAAVTNNGAVAAATLTDSEGNTWTALTRQTTASGATQIFYVHNPTTDVAHTVTVDAQVGNLASITFWAIAGSKSSSPFDQEVNNTGSATSGSITPTEDEELIVSVYQDAGSFNPGGVTVATFFSASASIPVVGGNRFAHISAIMIQDAAAAITCEFLPSNSITPCTSTASFKVEPSSGGNSEHSYAFA